MSFVQISTWAYLSACILMTLAYMSLTKPVHTATQDTSSLLTTTLSWAQIPTLARGMVLKEIYHKKWQHNKTWLCIGHSQLYNIYTWLVLRYTLCEVLVPPTKYIGFDKHQIINEDLIMFKSLNITISTLSLAITSSCLGGYGRF